MPDVTVTLTQGMPQTMEWCDFVTSSWILMKEADSPARRERDLFESKTRDFQRKTRGRTSFARIGRLVNLGHS